VSRKQQYAASIRDHSACLARFTDALIDSSKIKSGMNADQILASHAALIASTDEMIEYSLVLIRSMNRMADDFEREFIKGEELGD